MWSVWRVSMASCRCNRSGRCQNCMCAKSGRQCQGCLPQRLGNCVTTVRTPPSQVANLALRSPQNSTPRSSCSSPPPLDFPPRSSLVSLSSILSIYPPPFKVKPPNKGDFGDGPVVPCREVVFFSEVFF